MHPAFLDNMSWEMAEVYGAITDQILINLARHFPFYEYVDDIPTSAFTYQAQMLAQMGQVNKETVRIIRNGLEDADLALQGVLEQAIIDAVKTAEPELLDGVKKGVFQMPTTPIVAPNQMRAFQLYYEQAAQKLNLVNTVMLESTQSAYQQMVSDVVSEIELADRLNRTQIALDTATGEVVTGVSSWNQAIQHATDRLKDGGIVGFVDHAGRHWSAEAYVAMDMRTTVFNTGRAATWETNQNFGNDLYIVSYHNGARPLCYPWQNKVISSLDAARVTYDLDGNEIQVIAQSDTSYGQPAGLFGINCKHYPTPFIPGVSVIEGQPQDPEANAKTYEESQEQRRLERKLREEKRDLLMLKEQGASEEAIAKQREKCRKTSEDIDTFCKETGRARHRDREAVYTKREFPDKDRYDVAKFEHEQKDLIDRYYRDGGEQQNYTFGQMTQKEPPQTPTPAPTPTPAQQTAPVPVAPQNVTSQVTQSAQNVVQSSAGVRNVKDFNEYKQYMSTNYGIDVTNGVKKLDFDLVKEATSGFEDVARDFPEVTKGIKRIRLSKSGVMSCNGEQITFNSDYFTDQNTLKNEITKCVKTKWWQEGTTVASIGAHETAHGIEMVLIEQSGKYNTQMSKVLAWNNCYEARDIVKEACDELLKLPENNGKSAFELIKEGVSRYGSKGGNSETMAEAFADVNARGASATPLALKIYEITLKTYRKYMGVAP